MILFDIAICFSFQDSYSSLHLYGNIYQSCIFSSENTTFDCSLRVLIVNSIILVLLMTNLVFDGPFHQHFLYQLLNLDEQDVYIIKEDFQVLQHTVIA